METLPGERLDPERRQRQAALVRTWKPWIRSTGPKSETGKAKVARNAFKGGWRPQLRELARALVGTAGSLDPYPVIPVALNGRCPKRRLEAKPMGS
ncbi:MAG: hypothetical protein R3F37_22880 [Candidatus Competibacteraceae bacterium]